MGAAPRDGGERSDGERSDGEAGLRATGERGAKVGAGAGLRLVAHPRRGTSMRSVRSTEMTRLPKQMVPKDVLPRGAGEAKRASACYNRCAPPPCAHARACG